MGLEEAHLGAGAGGEHQRFRRCLNVQGDDDLVSDLARLSGAILRTDMGDILAHEIEQRFRAGERVGLVGESGCGKSTLLRTILALDAPQAGSITLHGAPLSQARGAALRLQRRRLQVVFQDPFGSFDPRWRVERVVAEPFHLLDQVPDARTRRRKVDEVLECVGLRAADADRYPHEFSGGQRQRIAIARALITEPEIIAFDEAVSALDVTVRAQILDLLGDIAQQRSLAYLFVSHDLAIVRAITDRVYVMQAGRIVEQGPTEQVFTIPSHVYTKRLLAALPRLSHIAMPGETEDVWA